MAAGWFHQSRGRPNCRKTDPDCTKEINLMALIPYPQKEELGIEAREPIEAFEREHGRPTLVRLMAAHFPPALRAIDAMYHPFMTQGRLERRTKELIFVASSNQRGCFY
jgi:hypothetical protein